MNKYTHEKMMVYEEEYFAEELNIKSWIALIKEKIKNVPRHHRKDIIIKIEGDEAYRDSFASIIIYYTRLITDIEKELTADKIERDRIRMEDQERETLAKLKAKYEGNG